MPGLLAATISIVTALLPAAAPQRPSVAVFALDIKAGISADEAGLVLDYVVEEVRRTDAFRQVVSSREIEALLGLERQRQLMDCNASSCVAELAGALGVDMVLAGSLGRLGGYYLVNFKLLQVNTGSVLAGFSHKVCGEHQDHLVRAIRPAVQRLLGDAKLLKGTNIKLEPLPPEECGAVVIAAPVTEATPASSPLGGVLRGVGGIGVAAGAGLGGLALIAGGGAAALLGVFYAVPQAREGLVQAAGPEWFVVMHLPSAAGAVVGAGLLLGALLLAAVGSAAFAAAAAAG